MFYTYINRIIALSLLSKDNTSLLVGIDKEVLGGRFKQIYSSTLGENEIQLNLDERVNIKYNSLYDAHESIRFLDSANRLDDIASESINELRKKSNEKESLSEVLKSGFFDVLVVNTDDGARLKELTEYKQPISGLKLFINTKKEVAEKSGMNFPGLLIYNSMDKLVYQTGIPKNGAEIISRAKLSCFDFYSEANQSLMNNYSGELYLYFTDEEETDDEIRYKHLPEFKELVSSVKVTIFKKSSGINLINQFGIQEDEFPALAKLEDHNRKYIVKNIKQGGLGKAIGMLREDKGEKVILNQPIPEDNESRSLKIANFKTFSKEVLENESTNRIVLFSSEMCFYCREAKPVYELMGNVAKDKSWPLKIYNYDIQFNEKPEEKNINIDGIPTIYFIRKGSQELELISSLRTTKDLLKFLEGKVEGIDNAEDLEKKVFDKKQVMQDIVDELKEEKSKKEIL